MKSNRTNKKLFLLGNHALAVLPRLAIGGTLFYSAVNKLPMHSEFVNLVNSYHLLPVWMGTAYATALPWVELLVGAYLILGILVRPSAIVAALMGISFMVANVSSLIRGDEHCLSCFGEAVFLAPAHSLIIDGVIVAIAVYLMTIGCEQQALCFDSWCARKKRPTVNTSP
jgi:uncharacterized membrane protein YphA (DoxX/SURF4 family)